MPSIVDALKELGFDVDDAKAELLKAKREEADEEKGHYYRTSGRGPRCAFGTGRSCGRGAGTHRARARSPTSDRSDRATILYRRWGRVGGSPRTSPGGKIQGASFFFFRLGWVLENLSQALNLS